MKKPLISLHPLELNEVEMTSACCFSDKQPTVVHLSISLSLSPSVVFNVVSNYQRILESVSSTCADVIIRLVCQMEMSSEEKKNMSHSYCICLCVCVFVCVYSAVQQSSACNHIPEKH